MSQVNQGIPDVRPKVLPAQMGCIIPPVSSLSTTGSCFNWSCLEEAGKIHLGSDQMPEIPEDCYEAEALILEEINTFEGSQM